MALSFATALVDQVLTLKIIISCVGSVTITSAARI
jgi:hypothetical protein